ncbi:probable protein phosphatase 2C 40 isoform X3 [Benincasa hispida]|uniref:probable protein phosphatase 2C 40 isoform X3 n=1 Tax=Benincasa hispida TaxID=102211 RepID=UPI001901B3D6|nr:probable protein phosphatase 2C 40 isoform X3 [Benincasa hispida]
MGTKEKNCLNLAERLPDHPMAFAFKSYSMLQEASTKPEGELEVSFGYKCNGNIYEIHDVSDKFEIQPRLPKISSFSCLSGAALSANATLANTNICNGLIGEEILPTWDSPTSFRKVPSSPTLSRLDILSSSLQSSLSNLSCSPSTSTSEYDSYLLKSMSAPSGSEGFLNVKEVQVAGGAAGEDRVQAVCSEENGWLFCAIYDGFNGRDAADFLAGTLYETIVFYFNLLDWEAKNETSDGLDMDNSHLLDDSSITQGRFPPLGNNNKIASDMHNVLENHSYAKAGMTNYPLRYGVFDSLQRALSQTENDFLHMVEQEMEDRPDLVSVGSCVLVVLLHGKDLYTLNLGDSRAVLATLDEGAMRGNGGLKAVQLTESHTVDNELERAQLQHDHPDDPTIIVGGKVKGKLKVTRAFGVGYLKTKKFNDALMGILRVRNLISPPYISTQPALSIHRISKSDCFVIVGSDGLFDFFDNEEAVNLVHSYILSNPTGDPAKFLLEQLLLKAADCAGFSKEELITIPAGRRRKYHDDVTVIVIILGTNQRTTRASTSIE